mgnify:CR=1 FL=1
MTAETEIALAKQARVTRRRAETRARLLDAAYHVFANKGFGRTRIEDVCAAAGYTRGAFYSQFDSLDSMFFTLYERQAEVITQQVAAAISVDGEGLALAVALERVASTLLLDRDWLLVKGDFLMHAARHPDLAQRLLEHRARLQDALKRQLAAVSANAIGSFPTPEAAAHAVVAAYDGVTTQLLLDEDLPAARRWLEQLLAALLTTPPR